MMKCMGEIGASRASTACSGHLKDWTPPWLKPCGPYNYIDTVLEQKICPCLPLCAINM